MWSNWKCSGDRHLSRSTRARKWCWLHTALMQFEITWRHQTMSAWYCGSKQAYSKCTHGAVPLAGIMQRDSRDWRCPCRHASWHVREMSPRHVPHTSLTLPWHFWHVPHTSLTRPWHFPGTSDTSLTRPSHVPDTSLTLPWHVRKMSSLKVQQILWCLPKSPTTFKGLFCRCIHANIWWECSWQHGDARGALHAMPNHCANERRLLECLIKVCQGMCVHLIFPYKAQDECHMYSTRIPCIFGECHVYSG